MDMLSLTQPMTFATTATGGLAAILLGGIGVRCVLAPIGGARFYGVHVSDKDGAAFVQAMGARNIGMSVTALALIILSQRTGLSVLIAAAALMACLDAVIVWRAAGLGKAAKHIAYVPAFIAFMLWIASGY